MKVNPKLIKGISTGLGILIAASLLSGANVAFNCWFTAPERLSKPLVMMLTFYSAIKISHVVLSFIFSSK